MSDAAGSPKRFVVDSMLGKLAKWLRVLGICARYERLITPGQLGVYRDEGYLLVTRNQKWCTMPGVVCLSSNDPVEQLQELVARVPVTPEDVRWLRRCLRCNVALQPIGREEAFGAVPDYVFETQTVFYRCPQCHRIYWPGSHPKRMAERLRAALGWPVQT